MNPLQDDPAAVYRRLSADCMRLREQIVSMIVSANSVQGDSHYLLCEELQAVEYLSTIKSYLSYAAIQFSDAACLYVPGLDPVIQSERIIRPEKEA